MAPGTLKNITISDFKSIETKGTANSTVMGMKGFPLENIRLENILIQYSEEYDSNKHKQLKYLEDMTEHCAWPGYWGKENYYPAKGFEFRYIDGLVLKNVTIESVNDPRPSFIGSNCENVIIDGEIVDSKGFRR
jgi:hypothetical protein